MQGHRSPSSRLPSSEQLFGEVLRELRRERGVSQEDLAFASGYHPTYIGQLERGKKSPSLRTIMSLAAVLGVLGSEILRRIEARSTQSG
jgi:transcriptional regulator with XRE-family HTH domain